MCKGVMSAPGGTRRVCAPIHARRPKLHRLGVVKITARAPDDLVMTPVEGLEDQPHRKLWLALLHSLALKLKVQRKIEIVRVQEIALPGFHYAVLDAILHRVRPRIILGHISNIHHPLLLGDVGFRNTPPKSSGSDSPSAASANKPGNCARRSILKSNGRTRDAT